MLIAMDVRRAYPRWMTKALSLMRLRSYFGAHALRVKNLNRKGKNNEKYWQMPRDAWRYNICGNIEYGLVAKSP
jgi:hypothetical protein